MPTYIYENCSCYLGGGEPLERNVPIVERDNQKCICGETLKRKIVFTGLTWAPTAGGMR